MYNRSVHLLLLLPVFAFAKTPAEIFSIASPSVVVVRVLDEQGKIVSLGSGVVIALSQVVTNCHVTNRGARLEVKSGRSVLAASLRYADGEHDLCQLAVPGLTAPSVKIRSVKRLKVGARVVALGAPQGLELSLSDGIVSALREVGDVSIIQTTAPISPGSSGGGLFDEEGRLIGITTLYLNESQNLNFALPADWVLTLPGRAKAVKAKAFDESAWLLKAITLEQSNEWEALLAHARAWSTENPSSAWAWFSLGYAYSETSQNERAIKALREAVQINPTFAEAWNSLGLAYGHASQSDEAIKALQEALRINHEFAGAWNNLGLAYFKVGQTDQAISAFLEALRINPRLTEAWYNLGLVYGKTGQSDQAIGAFRAAIRVNAEYAKAWAILGVAYREAGQTDQAIQAYREALRINPRDAETWYNIGVAYEIRGERFQVLEVYRQLQVLDAALADRFFNAVIMPR